MKLTEGQRYTVAILVVVAALLTSSLTRLHGRVAELISAPGPAVTTTTAPPSATASTARTPLPTGTTGPPATRPTSAPTTARPATAPSSTTTTLGEGESAEPDVPCPADDAVQGVRKVLEELDALLGDIVPSATVVTTLAIITGCSRTEPLVLILAALVEVGEGLPDLGLGFLELPVLPFIDLPDPVVELLQPLRPALDPICDTVGTVGLLLSQTGPAYPYPLDKTFAVSLFYLTSTCGQVQRL